MRSSSLLLERLHDCVLIGDGGMGSYLHARGVPLEATFEHLNVTAADLVAAVHDEYIRAGAQATETNTFAANRNKLAAANLEEEVRSINVAGARIARAAAGPRVYVLGSVGPLGRSHLGEELDSAGIFREQIEALAEGGVDALILETFSDLDELLVALRVARAVCDLPVITQSAFLGRGRIGSGADAGVVAQTLTEAGADVIGGNCGPGGPAELLRVVQAMAPRTTVPLSAFPNASFPKYADGRFTYVSNAVYFSDLAERIADAGANLIGGCCGTTPEHIRQIADRLTGRRPAPRPAAPPEPPRRRTRRTSPRLEVPSVPHLLEANRHAVNVIVEVDPPRGLNCEKAIRVSADLKRLGANAVSIAENQLASVRMSSFALSYLIQRETGMTAICHCTCRDRNLLGQQSELMGAAVLGVRHILAITGDPVSLDGSGGTSVFDTNSFGLIELLSRLNRGENLRGESISRPTEFVIGAGLNPNRARMDAEVRRLEKKVALGATFAMTQPPSSLDMLRELHRQTREIPVEVFVGVIPFVSHRNVEFLHNEVPGIKVAEDARRRMREASDPIREGVEIAKEYMDAAIEAGFRGIYIIPMLGKYEMAYELVSHVRKP